MIWDQLTSAEIRDVDRDVPVVLPLTATEQHGNHLPLGTDRMIADHFMNHLQGQLPDDVLILPTVQIGCSHHHLDFEGTLSLQHHSFEMQVKDIVSSVFKCGFRNLMLFNSHGGNQAIGLSLLEQLGFAYPQHKVFMVTWWKLAAEALAKLNESGPGGVGHAGEFETSLMMLIAPQLVRTEFIKNGDNQSTYPWAEIDMLRGAPVAFYRSMKQMTPNGVFGDPRSATKEKGQRITDLITEELKQIVLDIKNSRYQSYPSR